MIIHCNRSSRNIVRKSHDETARFAGFALCGLFRSEVDARFLVSFLQDYPEVWFLGLEAKKVDAVPGAPQNNGFDDENGSYIKVSF